MNQKKYGYLIIALLLVFSCCFSACNREKQNEIIAYSNQIYGDNEINLKKWTIRFEKNQVVSMEMKLYFDTQEGAEEYYDMMLEAYEEYPEYNIRLLEKQITYNYFVGLVQTHYVYHTYKDMIKEIKSLGGWTIEGMEA